MARHWRPHRGQHPRHPHRLKKPHPSPKNHRGDRSILERINLTNSSFFDTLVQSYEEEFSSITGKTKNDDGLYELDSTWEKPYEGFYWNEEGKRIGFIILKRDEKVTDVAEFYITPSARRKGAGRKFAYAAFDHYKGKWQVRQIEGAESAKSFWRSVINSYTSGDYLEEEVDDPVWGPVTRQTFNSAP